MGIREWPRLFFANRPSGAPAFVDSPNLFTDGGEVEVRAFDHPGAASFEKSFSDTVHERRGRGRNK